VDVGERDAIYGHGSNSVKEDLKGAEEGFAEDGVEDEGLKGGREVGVGTVNAEALVVG
jgi:hypothetical protein